MLWLWMGTLLAIVRKRVSGSSAPVLVAFAGLEGTGHHMICACLGPRSLQEKCHDERQCFQHMPRIEQSLKALTFTSSREGRTRSNRTLALSMDIARKTLRSLPRESNRRFTFQCTNHVGSTEGFKWSYPD